MRKVTTFMQVNSVTLRLVVVSLFLVLALEATATWLTSKVRIFGVLTLLMVTIAGLLVMYFEWRSRLRNRAWLVVATIERPREDETCAQGHDSASPREARGVSS